MSKVEWSEYQRLVFDTYKNENCNIAVEAGPGSGKTTLLKQLCKLTPTSSRTIFLAFNRSIVDELKLRLPASTEVSTLHGLGCRMLYKHYGKVKVVESKTFGILKKLESKWKDDLKDIKNVNHYLYNLSDLYDIYRMNLLTKVDEEIEGLAYRFNIETNPLILEQLNTLVTTMEKVNKTQRGIFEIDYLDMIYLPVVQDFSSVKYDSVFLDEAQDLNLCQHALVEKLLGRNSRLISVGDPRQCIYAFLGASSNSFESFSLRPNTKTLSLPITYRCPIKVVEKINTIFNVVKPAPTASVGEVRDGSFDEVREEDMVLCRNNKPLLQAYFRLLEDNIPCFVRGAEFGKGILRMILPYKHYSLSSLFEKLYRDLEKLEERLALAGVFAPRKHKSYLAMSENIDLVEVITRFREFYNVEELIPVVEQIFKDNGNGIMLSTIHKAKGLEADRVFLLNPELIPSKYATQDWEIDQENKLLFVAYSRPRKELIFVRNFNKE